MKYDERLAAEREVARLTERLDAERIRAAECRRLCAASKGALADEYLRQAMAADDRALFTSQQLSAARSDRDLLRATRRVA